MSGGLRHDVEDVSQFCEECVELVPPFLLGEVPGVPFTLVHHTLAVVEVHHGCIRKTITSIRTGGDARRDRVLLRTGPGFRFVWRLPITSFGLCFLVNPHTVVSLPYYPIHLKEKIISKLIQKSKVVYLRCQKVRQHCKHT